MVVCRSHCVCQETAHTSKVLFMHCKYEVKNPGIYNSTMWGASVCPPRMIDIQYTVELTSYAMILLRPAAAQEI